MILLALWAALAAPSPSRYAIVVGNNVPLDSELGTLNYADDDAARLTELLSANGVEVRLLSVFDADTQRLYPELLEQTRAPTKRELTRTLNEIFGQMGSESEFYFVFAGHGQVRDTGQGEIQFLDGALTRAELYRDVIEPSPAAFNHLIIDACNAYFMVAARGATAAGDYRSLVRSFVAQESLDRFPNTGVLVSTVGDAEVHEWSKIQSGVFTHQLRSALSGAADADRDGRVDYNEVEAFLAAANGKVEDPRARVNVFARAPALNARTA
ncbi:MAG: caspase family protein, partial [Myxococcota bacterium]